MRNLHAQAFSATYDLNLLKIQIRATRKKEISFLDWGDKLRYKCFRKEITKFFAEIKLYLCENYILHMHLQ